MQIVLAIVFEKAYFVIILALRLVSPINSACIN